MKKLLLGTFALLMFSNTAMAGFLIDPYLGFRFNGSIEEEANVGDLDEYSYSGLAYGARLGYNYLGLMLGFDYGMASGDVEQDKDPGSTVLSGVGTKVDGAFKNMGLYIGYDMPLLLRFWATYYFKSEMEIEGENNNNSDLNPGNTFTDTYKGSGLGLGVGYTGLPFLSINLEYKTFTYDEIESTDPSVGTVNLPAASTSTYGSSGEQKASEILLSVSVPFEFL
ncbi:MAG: outer membrane beta-barrel protein [Bacteriovoracaceae bacterium]|nr:outer membrane beta-barrel protein [Bacteriovoracaceae bacterium]